MAATQQRQHNVILPSSTGAQSESRPRMMRSWFSAIKRGPIVSASVDGHSSYEEDGRAKHQSTFGILADKETDEVPGTVVLLTSIKNEPLGLHRMESHRDDVDVKSPQTQRSTSRPPIKRTPDGKIVLDPQPEESPNDPLNWPAWRRDIALLSLGYYCMLGGGMTPILAAGFNNVAETYDVTYSDVALTTGLFMMGLGIGSVFFSPTAILWGKRPVYLAGSVLFILSAVWCALAPSYAQLVIARIFQGIAVSPVECLPSSTIAEIFFLHERAFRIGIYTLLLLGGKNLIPLVSAAIIESLGWRWVFWIVAMCVGFGGVLLFLLVPETVWDRTPRSKKVTRMMNASRSLTSLSSKVRHNLRPSVSRQVTERSRSRSRTRKATPEQDANTVAPLKLVIPAPAVARTHQSPSSANHPKSAGVHFESNTGVPHLYNLNSPYYSDLERGDSYFSQPTSPAQEKTTAKLEQEMRPQSTIFTPTDTADPYSPGVLDIPGTKIERYTSILRKAPAQPWIATLKPYNGRISHVQWWRVACRPFVLYAYPSILWSSLVYSLSVGWLIVLSESVTNIFKNRESYNFTSIQTGLVYISPFIGGVLGTAVAGKLSDVIVRFMARRNRGIYEPEFRLTMAIPITIATAVGLMGYGWSAQERDNFMVPTVFFGIISFGCCIGSTTAITFAVDSYRQFAGEALVTLNFSKNILHGLVWSLFFASWLEDDGPRTVFLAIGGIQIACMLTTIPMYIYGKRARMWTVRKRLMERL